MKVLLVNGSAHQNGTTMRALKEMTAEFEKEGVETEIIQVGAQPLADCLQCNYCQTHDHTCILKDDGVNDFIKKSYEADGFVFASPIYFAHPSGRLLSFLDRAFYADGKDEEYDAFKFKPGAAVAVARRGGSSAGLDVINKYFGIAQMPVAGSTYWNMLYGLNASDADDDAEGLQTMRNLAKNMVWMLRSFAAGQKSAVAYPQTETVEVTNFVRRSDGKR